jgi:hydroxymethylpyrimidine/phosphomethylpyrimidine kinase
MRGRVLVVAGSDSGGGAGIQADIKTILALGGYAATAITALTAQNTLGVAAVHAVPADFVLKQMEVVLSDIGADCIKTGMLGDASVVAALAEGLERFAPGIPVVVDPVMVAKGGAALLAADANRLLIERVLPRATLLTPNIPEAEALLGRAIPDVNAMEAAARDLLALGPQAVLLKGGHMDESGAEVVDVLANAAGFQLFRSPRLASRSTHGTGCTLASGIATGLAQGLDLVAAIRRARAYLFRAIETAPGLGAGHGPVNHGHVLEETGNGWGKSVW